MLLDIFLVYVPAIPVSLSMLGEDMLLIGRSFDSAGTNGINILTSRVSSSILTFFFFLLCPMSTSWRKVPSCTRVIIMSASLDEEGPRLNVFQSRRNKTLLEFFLNGEGVNGTMDTGIELRSPQSPFDS